jgi:hypothetical protein
MPQLTPDTVIPGVVYVVWVKESKTQGALDGIHAVISKTASKFGYSDFMYVVENCHGKLFMSQKINNGDENPSWKDCLDDLEVFKAPVGNPLSLVDKVYSFSEVTHIAYDKGYFSSEDGLSRLHKKLANVKSGGKTKPAPTKEPAVNAGKVLATAKELSDKLLNVSSTDAAVSSNPFPPGPPILAENVPSVASLWFWRGGRGVYNLGT